MTYHNKLLIRRALLILVIVAAAVFLLLLIGFTYLGRYVVYTEDGAHFSFHSAPPSPQPTQQAALSEDFPVVTGDPVTLDQVVSEDQKALRDNQVKGILLDYATLKAGTGLNQIELIGDGENNTLVMEMRATDREMLGGAAVKTLISRAKSQELHLAAIVSCLSDSEYALAHRDMALTIDGGALWMGSAGSYWLDPGNEKTISYLKELFEQLADMGFDEVILNDFYLPDSSSLVYDYDGRSSEEITSAAYTSLREATMDICQIGLLVTDPYEGHQAFDAADRIYVCYEDGSTVKEYAQNHADQYLVFITGSHDTRFNAYGKIQSDGDFTQEAIPDENTESAPAEPEQDETEDTETEE